MTARQHLRLTFTGRITETYDLPAARFDELDLGVTLEQLMTLDSDRIEFETGLTVQDIVDELNDRGLSPQRTEVEALELEVIDPDHADQEA